MTAVKFFESNGKLTGFEISGHSGFAPEGEDIVCAGISSAAIMAANTLTEIIGAKAQVRESDGGLSVLLDSPAPGTEIVLKGLRLHLEQLSEQYPQFIKIFSEV